MLNTEKSPTQNQQESSHKCKGGMNEQEISDKYLKPLKPHASESTNNSTQMHNSAQENGPTDKKKTKSAEKHLGHLNIPTFSERNLRVYQKLGEGK